MYNRTIVNDTVVFCLFKHFNYWHNVKCIIHCSFDLQIECSDGSIGYGRRRRAIASLSPDPNKIFEISISSFIHVNYGDDSENFESTFNQTRQQQRNKLYAADHRTEEPDNRLRTSKNLDDRPRGKALITEEVQYTAIVAETNSAMRTHVSTCFVALMLFLLR